MIGRGRGIRHRSEGQGRGGANGEESRRLAGVQGSSAGRHDAAGQLNIIYYLSCGETTYFT